MERQKLEQEIALYETWKEQRKFRNPLFTIFRGEMIHPIYSRTDLTPQEKDEIMLAYDWKQVGKSFDAILSR